MKPLKFVPGINVYIYCNFVIIMLLKRCKCGVMFDIRKFKWDFVYNKERGHICEIWRLAIGCIDLIILYELRRSMWRNFGFGLSLISLINLILFNNFRNIQDLQGMVIQPGGRISERCWNDILLRPKVPSAKDQANPVNKPVR